MNDPLPILVLLFGVLLVVSLITEFARIPYTVGLVIAGLAFGLVPNHPHVTFTPGLVMQLFLPPLLFAGAWTMSVSELRRNWLPIALLASVGVAIGILLSYILLVFGAGLSVRVALLFGAIVAATDPVAVIAIFRALRIDRRLATIVEGESLFNDGTAVVAFRVLLAALIAGADNGVASKFPSIAGQIALDLLGGAAAGALVGLMMTLILRVFDDYLLEATGTLLAAYGSYLLAERFHTSGIVAVVIAGMLMSGLGRIIGSFTNTRLAVNQFWEFAAFLANSTLFLMVGLAINLQDLVAAGAASAWGILAVVAGRVLVVYGLSAVSRMLGAFLPGTWLPILTLGGMRGALSMALVLSLPYSLPERSTITTMVFSVVLFTLVVQGLGLSSAINALRLRSAASDANGTP
ncbi:MAG: sodium:proton antiporter [Acidobacteriota bacterium]|nr:sodium:proton antiporter [Acidobacteriota bacterium]